MLAFPILSLVTFLPLVGAALSFIVAGRSEHTARNARAIALWTSLIVFALSLLLWLYFDPNNSGFHFVEKEPCVPQFNIGYHLGIAGISLFFVLLSTLLIPV